MRRDKVIAEEEKMIEDGRVKGIIIYACFGINAYDKVGLTLSFNLKTEKKINILIPLEECEKFIREKIKFRETKELIGKIFWIKKEIVVGRKKDNYSDPIPSKELLLGHF